MLSWSSKVFFRTFSARLLTVLIAFCKFLIPKILSSPYAHKTFLRMFPFVLTGVSFLVLFCFWFFLNPKAEINEGRSLPGSTCQQHLVLWDHGVSHKWDTSHWISSPVLGSGAFQVPSCRAPLHTFTLVGFAICTPRLKITPVPTGWGP